MTAVELRARFKAIPKEVRRDRQGFSIRVWRALSWLERAEQFDPADWEGRFILGWIALNALFGRQEKGKNQGDHESLGVFVTQVWHLDQRGRLRRFLFNRQLAVLRIIDNLYLCEAFWRGPNPSLKQRLQEEVNSHMKRFLSDHVLPVLLALFERLYVMRNQIFHGASTKGSSLNRRTIQSCSGLLIEALPLFIEVMLDHGLEEDWGAVCYPPTD